MSRDQPLASRHRFGAVLHEHDLSMSSSARITHITITTIVCVLILAVCVGRAISRDEDFHLYIIAATLLIALILVPSMLTYRGKHHLIRCHEHGLVVHRGRQPKEVPYTEIEWFRCQMVDHYYNGQYIGTRYEFRFGVRGNRRLRYDGSDARSARLAAIRDHLSNALAALKLEALRQGKSAAWAEGMEFTPKGLRVEPNTGKQSGRGSFVVPYRYRMKVEIEKGVFTLYVGSYRTRQACYRGKIDEPDFFPGLVVLATIQATQYAQEPESQEPAPWGEIEDSEPKSPFDFR